MKAITLWQPWASLWVSGTKRIETRSRSAFAKGGVKPTERILIHAAVRTIRRDERDLLLLSCPALDTLEYPLGCIVGAVTLTECVQMTPEIIADIPAHEKALGLWQLGRWAWYASDFELFDTPIKCRGNQGFWTPEPQVLELVESQLGAVV